MHAFDLRAGSGPVDETAPRVPADSRRHPAYDRSKAEGERRVRAAVARGLDAVVVHPTGAIGPCDFEPSRLGLFFLRLYRGTLPALVDGGCDFVDVRDVAGAMVAAAEGGGAGESYLLSGHTRRVADLAAVAAAVTGRRLARPVLPMWVARAGAPLLALAASAGGPEPLYTAESLWVLRIRRSFDAAKAARDLGFGPRPIEESVGDIYRWFAAQGMLDAQPRSGLRGPAGSA